MDKRRLRYTLFLRGVIVGLLLIILTVSFILSVNYYLSLRKREIEKNISSYLKREVSIGKIQYFPGNNLIIKNLCIHTSPGEKAGITINKIKVRFSPLQLLKDRRFLITGIHLRELSFDYSLCSGFLKKIVSRKILGKDRESNEKFSQLKNRVQPIFSISPNGFIVSIKDAKMSFLKGDFFPSYLLFNLYLKMDRKGKIFSYGRLTFTNQGLNRSFLKGKQAHLNIQYKVLGKLISEEGSLSKNKYGKWGTVVSQRGIKIDNFELNGKCLTLKLWGILNRERLALRGMLVEKSFFRGRVDKKEDIYTALSQFFNRVRKKFKTTVPIPLEVSSSCPNIDIFDISCLVKFSPHTVEIKKLSFSVDNLPLSLKGKIVLGKPLLVDLTLSSFPVKECVKLKRLKGFMVQLAGEVKEGRFNGKSVVTIKVNPFLKLTRSISSPSRQESTITQGMSKHLLVSKGEEAFDVQLNRKFSQGVKSEKFPHQVVISLKNLSSYLLERDYILRITAEEVDVFYKTENNDYKLILSQFISNFPLLGEEDRVFKFSSQLYGGSLQGEGKINLKSLPPPISFHLKIDNIPLNQINPHLTGFPVIRGKIRGNIFYENWPQFNWKGKLLVSDGEIDNLKFFDWLADFFDISFFKKLKFEELSVSFLVTPKIINFDKVTLGSSELILNGYGNIKEEGRINSKVSLIISRRLIGTSSKFKPLLKLLATDAAPLDFNFQLSGFLDRMNFKWLDSDFKKRLEKRLSPWIKRKIEKQIEEVIESIR